MIKIFKRPCWKRNPDWPDGYEPLAVSVDSCRTLQTVGSDQEARMICSQKNAVWRKHMDKVNAGTATPTQIRTYYESVRYEFTDA